MNEVTTIRLKNDNYVEKAASLFSFIDGEAEAIEQAGTITEPVVRGLKDSGILDMLLPAELGGGGIDARTGIDATAEITKANTAAGWVALVNSTVAAVVATYVSDDAAQEIFGDGTAILAGAFSAGGGTLKRVDGGYLYQGKLRFGSGIAHSTWVIGNGPELDENGEPVLGPGGVPNTRLVVIPRSSVELRGNWGHVMGLKGSGSYDYDVAETFVPEGRSFLMVGDEVRRNKPLGHLGSGGLIAIGQAGFPLGAAHRMMDEIKNVAPKRSRMSYAGSIAQQQMFQYGYGFHEAALDAARSHVHDIFSRAEAYCIEHDAPPPPADYVRLMQATCYAHRVSMEAIRFCFNWAGSSAIFQGPFERFFRDMEVADQHLFYDNMNFIRRAQVVFASA